jgi:acyl-homoserine-lactone acylase
LDVSTRTFSVRQADGSLKTETLRVRKSVQGPVVYEKEGTTLAVRVAGLDRPFMMEQYWQMATARDFSGFKKAAARNQVPMYNVVYADRDGHIMYLFNGTVPKRKTGDWRFWQGIVPGDTSETMWSEYHTYEELPKVIDPPAGYVQNTNDPPWNASWPQTLDPGAFPAYMSPKTASFRNERSIRLMSGTEKISFAEFVKRKHDTHSELADRILDELLGAATAAGKAGSAVAVLKAWDRTVDAESRGSILFLYWAQRFMGPAMADQSGFAVPYAMALPLTTPRGLKDPAKAVAALEAAAAAVEKDLGALDTPWGDVMKYRRGKLELPANGGFGNLGIFRVITFGPMKEQKREPIHGETYVVTVEFGKPRAQARALIGYGNSSQPGSAHIEDQLGFMTRKELRPVWREKKEILANLELREVF